MKIEKYNYKGNTNLGFYGTLTTETAIIPPNFKRKNLIDVEKIVETKIARTELVGLFTAGNKNGILIPGNTTSREKQKLDKANIDYTEINANETALGNLILANDKGAIISPKLKEHQEKIEKALEVDTETGKIAGIGNPGVCGAANNHGAVIHRAATTEEAEKIKETLQLENIDLGTINMGSPFIGSGIINNDKTILLGEDTTGPEIGRIDNIMINKKED